MRTLFMGVKLPYKTFRVSTKANHFSYSLSIEKGRKEGKLTLNQEFAMCEALYFLQYTDLLWSESESPMFLFNLTAFDYVVVSNDRRRRNHTVQISLCLCA